MRGNAVMRAKRTHGPTPNTVLRIACAVATCDKCSKSPVRTIPTAGAIVRACIDHIPSTAPVVRVGWRPDWLA